MSYGIIGFAFFTKTEVLYLYIAIVIKIAPINVGIPGMKSILKWTPHICAKTGSNKKAFMQIVGDKYFKLIMYPI